MITYLRHCGDLTIDFLRSESTWVSLEVHLERLRQVQLRVRHSEHLKRSLCHQIVHANLKVGSAVGFGYRSCEMEPTELLQKVSGCGSENIDLYFPSPTFAQKLFLTCIFSS